MSTANIAVTTANRIEVVRTYEMFPPSVAGTGGVSAGDAVIYDSDGNWIQADSTSGGNNGVKGIALKTAVAGEAVSVMKSGVLSGYTFTVATGFGDKVYSSDTAGAIADGVPAGSGSVTEVIGYCGSVSGNLLGDAKTKVLVVNL